MTSSRLRSFPSARRICRPSPLPHTAIPAESYPRYSRRRNPSIMTGTTLFLPTYPTMPHILNSYNCLFLFGDETYQPKLVADLTPHQEPETQIVRLRSDRQIIANDSYPLKLLFEGKTKFFDDRIGQNFTRHASNFCLRLRPG